MIRFIEDNDAQHFLQKEDICIDESVPKEYLVLDETIWERGREYFTKNSAADPIPVVDSGRRIICYAWQDKEARREMRMLWELEKYDDAITFHDLYPAYLGVTIHECNELAWYMAKYFAKRGIPVNVDGKFWKELGVEGCNHTITGDRNFVIWAEGVHQKSGDWKRERLRSASVEFECVNEIYEANIKAGKIADADGDCQALLERLQREKEIIIRGIGTKAQDAYDWLLSNGIDICAFQSGKPDDGRKSLFGKPILKKSEIETQFKAAVILECAAKHSAWGFGDTDAYAYGGYERNVRYLLLRDYLEVPENNLKHIFAGKNLILIGDIRLCNRAYRWWRQNGEKIREIKYWDVLEENESEVGKFQLSRVNENKLLENSVYLMLMSEHPYKDYLTKEAIVKRKLIVEKIIEYGISDYTDYFSDMMKCIHLETRNSKYKVKGLRPSGILLGAIPASSGNVLFRQILDGHPQIMTMDQVNWAVGAFLCIDLYFICIRLAEERSDNILADFWSLYQSEAIAEAIERDFPNKDKFNQKMIELLKLSNYFTSQELFVMFHLANGAMFGKEVEKLNSTVIYWEPHCWDRKYVREWAYWLGSSDMKGFTISMVRNRYIRAGSAIRNISKLDWWTVSNCLYGGNYVKRDRAYEYWQYCILKFEELKCNPRETLIRLCEWLGISYSDILMETTVHGEKAFYDGKITGFDIKPVYNLYEEYFTVFDRMRISITAGSYQRQYGYPYVSCLEFSRRELQEMFLKDFRWEKLQGAMDGKNDENMRIMLNRIRYLLWLERFAEIMKVELMEEY